jgi:hypothetical protein
MTNPTPTTPTETKTPGDFNTAADTFNASLDATLRDLAHARSEVARCMAERETLIASAGDYGLTASYARTLLRKA